jgi:hypothetical protein
VRQNGHPWPSESYKTTSISRANGQLLSSAENCTANFGNTYCKHTNHSIIISNSIFQNSVHDHILYNYAPITFWIQLTIPISNYVLFYCELTSHC